MSNYADRTGLHPQRKRCCACSKRYGPTSGPCPDRADRRAMLNKVALTSVLNSLLKQGLASEQPAKVVGAQRREDKDQKLTLVINTNGTTAVGAERRSPGAQPRHFQAPTVGALSAERR